MQIETERKFLVTGDGYKAEAVEKHRIRQGYIAHDEGRSVRVRIRDGKGILTVKGPFIGLGARPEWEKELTLQEAEDLFRLCIIAVRHAIDRMNSVTASPSPLLSSI